MSAEQDEIVTGVLTAVRAPIDEVALARYLEGKLPAVDNDLTIRQFDSSCFFH